MQVKYFIYLITFFSFSLNGQKVTELPVFNFESQQSLNDSVSKIAPVFVLKSTQIQNRNAINLAEMMAFLPGITLRDYGGLGGLKTVSLRGLPSSYTGVFIEDIRQLNLQSGSFDFGKVPARMLKAVNFNNGQTAKQGSSAAAYAFAGNFNISVFGEPKDSTAAEIGYTLGSFGLHSPYARVDLGKQKIQFFAFAEYTTQFGDYPFKSNNGILTQTKRRENGDFEQLQFWAGVRFTPNHKTEAKLILNFGSNQRGLPAADLFYAPATHQRLNQQDFQVQASINRRINSRTKVKYGGKIAQYETNYLNPLVFNSAGRVEEDYSVFDFYQFINIEHYLTENFKVFSSVDLTLQQLQSNRLSLGSPQTKNTQLLTGITYAKKRFFAELNGLSTFAKEQNNELNAPEKAFSNFAPAVRFNYFWVERSNFSLNFQAGARKLYRLPTFNEQYFSAIPNFDLKPELTKQLHIGLSLGSAKNQKTEWNAQLNLFAEQVENRIILLPTQNLFIWNARNLGEVRGRGLEFSASTTYRFNECTALNLFGNGTIQQILDFSDAESRNYGHQLAYTPVFSGTFGGVFTVSKFNLMLLQTFSGNQYSLPQPINSAFMPGWNQLDVSAWFNLKLYKKPVSLRAEILNVFNTQYAVIRSFPMPGIQYRFATKINF
jgi:vitamin B12 transporter